MGWEQLWGERVSPSSSESSLSWQCPHGPCGCCGSSGGLWGPEGPDTAPAVPKVHQSLQETVRSFKVTNEELAARGTGGDQDVAACDTACKVRDRTGRQCQISAPCCALLVPSLLVQGPAVGHTQDMLGTDVLVPVQPPSCSADVPVPAVLGPPRCQDPAVTVTGPCPPTQELLLKMKGRGFPWSRLLLVLLVLAAGFLLHDVQTHGSFQGRLGNQSDPGWENPLGASGKATTIPCHHKCRIHRAFKSPKGWKFHHYPGKPGQLCLWKNWVLFTI